MVRSALIGAKINPSELARLSVLVLAHPGYWHDRLCHWRRTLDAVTTEESCGEVGSSSNLITQGGGLNKDVKHLTGQ